MRAHTPTEIHEIKILNESRTCELETRQKTRTENKQHQQQQQQQQQKGIHRICLVWSFH